MSTGSEPSPAAVRFRELSLGELRDLAEMTALTAAAARVGLFRALLDGPATAEELARGLDLDLRAVGIVLPALADLELVESAEEHGGGWALTERGRRELADPSSPGYEARGLPHWLQGLRAWSHLDVVLQRGGPLGGGESEEPDDETEEERLERFMEAMAAAPEERVRKLVRATLERRPDARTALDLGGGPGHIARAFVDEGLAVTMVDTPETAAYVRDAYDLEAVDGLRVVGADFLADPLPDGPFDVVLLSNVTHIYPAEENRRLLGRVADVTEPGSVVAIQDFVRGHSPRAARFALLMLMKTEGGNTFSEDDYRSWLDEAGFSEMEVAALDPERQLVTAVRRD